MLAGSGARREVDEVARRAKGLRLGGRLSLAGAVNPAERTALFRRADVFVFPSRNEAQGLVLIEALAFGVPAVAYRIPGVASVVDDGSTGFLVPPGDIPGLVASVSELLSRPDLQERMATSAGRRFETTFSRDVYRENWRRVLEPSVGRPRGNGPELGVAR